MASVAHSCFRAATAPVSYTHLDVYKRQNLSYITIAVGRDYRDVSPTSGTYIAPYQGRLTASKRAGLTRVEYAVA